MRFLIIGTEMIPEMLLIKSSRAISHVRCTRLIAREDFIKFIRRESTKTYILNFGFF
jgi:hypothetical protein